MGKTVKENFGKKSIEERSKITDISDDIFELASRIGTVAFLLNELFVNASDERLERAAYMILEDSNEIMSFLKDNSGENRNNEQKGPFSLREREEGPETGSIRSTSKFKLAHG